MIPVKVKSPHALFRGRDGVRPGALPTRWDELEMQAITSYHTLGSPWLDEHTIAIVCAFVQRVGRDYVHEMVGPGRGFSDMAKARQRFVPTLQVPAQGESLVELIFIYQKIEVHGPTSYTRHVFLATNCGGPSLILLQRLPLPDTRRLSNSPNSYPERHGCFSLTRALRAKLYWAFPNPMLEQDIDGL